MNGTAIETSDKTHDDQVETQIAETLNLQRPRSFFLFAGAGSGKTWTLVEALKLLKKRYKDTLRLQGRQVAVITYTNAACNEIIRRIDFDPLFVVSTTHSFAWRQIQGFNSDIRDWLRTDLKRDIIQLIEKEQKGRAGTKASAARQAEIESKQLRLERLDEIKSFTYNPNGENRERNSLSHSEVIKLFSAFLSTKPLMQRMFVEKFPFLLIDESQDTNGELIDALIAVQKIQSDRFSLGLIGDTMQRIYADGKEKMEAFIPENWVTPAKKLNRRCAKRIVRLINRIREPIDRHLQEPLDDQPEGLVRLFLFSPAVRDIHGVEDRIRHYMATITNDPDWSNVEKCKHLILEHHMAAKRMGFQKMFEALAAISDYRTGFLAGTFGPAKFFTHIILPLVNAQRDGDKFSVAKIARENSPLLSKDNLKQSKISLGQFRSAQAAINELIRLWTNGEPTCGEILECVAKANLFIIPDSLKAALAARKAGLQHDDHKDPLDEKIKALTEFLDCSFSVIEPYAKYVAGEAHFDTHQGVKGLEFDRVMVLMDDEEARGFQFGYEKLLGARELSRDDLKNQQEGRETSTDRTRRLFYVTCSRAKSSLALVAYCSDPMAAKAHAIRHQWFEEDEIVLAVP